MRLRLAVALAACCSAPSLAAELPYPVTGRLFVGDFKNDRVVIYDATGALEGEFTAPGLDGPRGVLFAPNGEMLVASQLSSEIYRFDSNGKHLGQFAAPELSGPTGMTISPVGELHVASYDNGRICVFDISGAFQRFYTGPSLSTPNAVVFDSTGSIYATSALLDIVYKWDAAENFVTVFTAPHPFDLNSPMDITRDENDVLYVSGGLSHNIVKFNTAGDYIGEFGHPDLLGPQGVLFDENGHIWSASFFDHVLVEFAADESYLQTITEGGLDTPRCMSFEPAKTRARNGTGCNTIEFLSTSPPAVNSTWNSSIDLASSGGSLSALAISTGGAAPPGIKLTGAIEGELLCLPPYLPLDVATGEHSLGIPNSAVLVGLELCAQAASVSGASYELTNAIDFTIGTY